MKTLTKALVGTVAAGAMAVSASSPALARDRDGGIDTGDIVAGALIIGGIAAVAAAASNNNRDRYGYGRDYRYDRAGYRGRYRQNPRQAVAQCVSVAERNASRYSHGRADVTDIRSVKNKRNGYDIKGRIAVKTRGGHYRSNSRYGRGWDGDYRGYNNRHRGYDSGNFTCKIRHGRVVDIKYSGIRRLR